MTRNKIWLGNLRKFDISIKVYLLWATNLFVKMMPLKNEWKNNQ